MTSLVDKAARGPSTLQSSAMAWAALLSTSTTLHPIKAANSFAYCPRSMAEVFSYHCSVAYITVKEVPEASVIQGRNRPYVPLWTVMSHRLRDVVRDCQMPRLGGSIVPVLDSSSAFNRMVLLTRMNPSHRLACHGWLAIDSQHDSDTEGSSSRSCALMILLQWITVNQV
ncbi:unnamed protein product [Nesidiocoris tenuis]|uniref:Uncharacterized protein n=1 Tax=Nesidiocoris tenuis TaxID=355587 RepID=A0A6H5H8L4_9HEMI|nr:unnamed protein product [Nesidiocoris tenuis]